jgi:phosphoribulokinase
MSKRHPVVAITGSSGAGTTTVTRTFEHIFRREGITAAIVEGDSFHRYDRNEMKAKMAETATAGNTHFSHFGPDANRLDDLEALFRTYGESGTGKVRAYLHDAREAAPYRQDPGTFTPWVDIPAGTDLLFYEGLHGAAVTDTILRRMPDYVQYICPQFSRTHINFQRVPMVDTSNPFIAKDIPTVDESMVVIRFARPQGIDFLYLLSMLHDSYMSRPNIIVVPGGKMSLAMQLILTPMILQLMDRKRRAG